MISNNIFYQPTTAGVWFDTADFAVPGPLSGTVANNLTYGASLGTGSMSGLALTGNLTGDPRFLSPGSFNFQLQSGSPAIGRGLTLANVLNDILGVLRPPGGYDIGAYQ